jgi:hypothetical protein
MVKRSQHARTTKLLVDPPPQVRRRWINMVIVLVLASQIVTPLTYYLYKEPTNERFAWRMFSSVHMSDWNRMQIVGTTRAGGRTVQQVVPIEEMLVESSWKNLYAAQPDYRDKFLRYYLVGSGADQVYYEAQGVWPSGRPMEPIRATIRRGDNTVRLAADDAS